MDTVATIGKPYLPRIIDAAVQAALNTAGAVILEGPRGCGKTMSALNACNSYVFLDSPEAAQMLDISPRSLLEGERPRLLDEWQIAPKLWDLARRAVDAAPAPGSFILTGSAVPADNPARHTGAGRFLRLRQHTMSLTERGHSCTTVSLADLFAGNTPPVNQSRATLDDVMSWVLGTGFPALIDLPEPQVRTMLLAYLREVTEVDIPRLAQVGNEPVVFERLLQAIARSVSSDVKYQTLAADLHDVASSITAATISDYVGYLQRIFVVETQPAWTPKLTSKARLRTTRRLHLAEPALAAAALRANRAALTADLPLLGLLFESAVFHDLTVYAATLDGQVSYFRDSNGYEIDLIITLPDGRWGAIEVKLGETQIAPAAQSLNTALAQIDTNYCGAPAFRAVVTGLGPTFTLDDGTVTVPLNQLGP